jgi:hypothetical protein
MRKYREEAQAKEDTKVPERTWSDDPWAGRAGLRGDPKSFVY